MKNIHSNSRRRFFGTLATGAAATGISLIPNSIQAGLLPDQFNFNLKDLASGEDLEAALQAQGKKSHPVAYDVSQANPWGFIWSNVYYLTNSETGTTPDKLGVMNVLRHHGIIFAMNDATIAKYKLGEHFHYNDPVTKQPALRNAYYEPVEGAYPLPGLAGIKGLQANGAVFCVCDMARKVNAQFVAQKMGLKQEDVYKDFVAGTLPGIHAAPSGVWALGRLAENGIAYIDASVG
jgi:hypothetical protein